MAYTYRLESAVWGLFRYRKNGSRMTAVEEKTLVESARSGDVSAFEKLIELHERKIFAFAISLSGGNHALAEDIYQEALLKAFLAIGTFRGESSFKTWLWRIVRNEFLNLIKSIASRHETPIEDMTGFEPGTESTPEEALEEEERLKNLRKLLAMMPADYSEIITLIDLQELSYEETAEILGISMNLVKVRLFRARERLAAIASEHREMFL